MKMAITKMSSKGQIVVPAEMRQDIHEGEKFIIIRNDRQIILEKVSEFDKKLEEDLIFAKKTEEALKKYEKGEFIKKDEKEFFEELEKW
tara:strand:+ start:1382 stop:1648 length:267 start_codon:yes stop_codon:yes gene_type:complete